MDFANLPKSKFDKWIWHGILKPENPSSGSGHPHIFTRNDMLQAKMLTLLNKAGVRLELASRIVINLKQNSLKTPYIFINLETAEVNSYDNTSKIDNENFAAAIIINTLQVINSLDEWPDCRKEKITTAKEILKEVDYGNKTHKRKTG